MIDLTDVREELTDDELAALTGGAAFTSAKAGILPVHPLYGIPPHPIPLPIWDGPRPCYGIPVIGCV